MNRKRAFIVLVVLLFSRPCRAVEMATVSTDAIDTGFGFTTAASNACGFGNQFSAGVHSGSSHS